MSLCPEGQLRAAMTDAEFWEHVFARTPEDEASWADYSWAMDGPDVWVISCARCGDDVEVTEETRINRERDAFCDNCADETLPDEEDHGC